ncbi:hypothetical protein BT69DRAFT_741838 [Atractiella rhizophila]|nr:hypothetical protein BT69DRAFT_741838 [Atractiella rhizophila]
MSDKLTRIAIVNPDRCKPKKCRQECKKSCPVVRTGKLCIEVDPSSKIAFINPDHQSPNEPREGGHPSSSFGSRWS